MSLFDDEPVRQVRSGADWELHRRHRTPQSGPPQDEVGLLALSSFQLARTEEVVVAVRGITAYSDGVQLSLVVLFADEQRAEDVGFSMTDFGRNPGRFRFGCVFSDGRAATTGTRDAPPVEAEGGDGPVLLLLSSASQALTWAASVGSKKRLTWHLQARKLILQAGGVLSVWAGFRSLRCFFLR